MANGKSSKISINFHCLFPSKMLGFQGWKLQNSKQGSSWSDCFFSAVSLGFLAGNVLEILERAGCFVLTFFLVSCDRQVSVVWVGLICVIVIFPAFKNIYGITSLL